MITANLAVRFMLELAAVGALAAWGWQTSETLAIRLLAAILAPAALIVVWAIVVAPGATNPIPQSARMLVGTGLLLVAAGALAIAGRPELAALFAVAIVVNHVLLLLLGRQG